MWRGTLKCARAGWRGAEGFLARRARSRAMMYVFVESDLQTVRDWGDAQLWSGCPSHGSASQSRGELISGKVKTKKKEMKKKEKQQVFLKR